MSNPVQVLGRVPFSAFDAEAEGMPFALAESVLFPRARVEGLIGSLPAKRNKIEQNKYLSPEGKADELEKALRAAEADIKDVYGPAPGRAMSAREDAMGQLNSRMFAAVETNDASSRDRFATAKDEIAAVANEIARDPKGKDLPHDADGVPLLAAGSDGHKRLMKIVQSAPVEDAQLVVLASLRSGPVTRSKLGTGVTDALLAALGARMAASDPEVAHLVATRATADRVLSTLKNDLPTALNAAAKQLGLNAGSLSRPDPVADAAKRKTA